MDISQQILSDITVHMKYAKYSPKDERRETWEELVDRNKSMHIEKFSNLKEEIDTAYKLVYEKKILPSMRSMQFAGKPINLNPVRIFNCSYLPIDDWRAFQEVMFLLLSGTGVGFSVQKHHTEKLPDIKKPRKDKTTKWVIADSIEGWSDAIKVLIKSYFKGTSTVRFVYDDIRAKGERLVTAGGKAPGPEPLKICIANIRAILDQKEDGTQLTPLEVHDIVCHIADSVLAGGIRRSALISLFSADDIEMMACKSGNWWELNPQRGRANNSAVLLRHMITEDKFKEIWERVEASKAGEPGVYFTNDKDIGTNPCAEISLRAFQFCNLCEVNISNVESQEDLEERVRSASLIGTLQASYTDFHYLRPIWKKTTEKDALIGVGLTGVGSGKFVGLDFDKAGEIVKAENERIADLIGINKASRATTIKPSGTSSLVCGTSSGIHAWHNDYYIRRLRVGKNEAIYAYLSVFHPELLEDEYFRPDEQAVISIPQKAPDGAMLRTESPIKTLNRVKKFFKSWIKSGHRDGQNTNNISVTVSLKDKDWEKVGDWMWENKDSYNAISVLNYDGGTYKQAPFEDITKEQFEEMSKHLHAIDLSKVIELEDNTDLKDNLACYGGNCTIVEL